MNDKIKQMIFAIVVIVIAFVIFKTYFSNSGVNPDATLVTDGVATVEAIDGQVILALLENLKRVTLDDSIFANDIFTSLTNFERPIEPQPMGRQNPFLPIGREF